MAKFLLSWSLQELDKTTLNMKLFQVFPPQRKLSAIFFFPRKVISKSFSSTEKMLRGASDALKGMCHHESCGSCSPQSPL